MNKDRLLGIFYLVVGPAVLVIGAVIYVIMSLPLMVGIICIFALAYGAFLSGKVDYGPKQIRKIRIPGAPKEIEDFLKTTTNNGELMHAYLISGFGEEDERLSQTELVNRVREKHDIQLTDQSIRNYIKNLETHKLISSPPTSREREYSLTDYGRWCYKAIKVCLPRTALFFILRYYMGYRRLKEFSNSDAPEHTTGS